MRNDFPQIKKRERVANSAFQILDVPQTLQKHGGQYIKFTFHPSSTPSSLG